MEPITGQTFQWSFGVTTNMGDNPSLQGAVVPPAPLLSSPLPITKPTGSPTSSTASNSNNYKPYSSSTLWNPALHNKAENPTETFLSLTPVSKKQTKSSLPFISLTQPKQEMTHDKERLENNDDNDTRPVLVHQKPFEHNSTLLVPTVGLRIKPPFSNQSKPKKKDDVIKSRESLFQIKMATELNRRLKQQGQQGRHRQEEVQQRQEETEKKRHTSVPKLPQIDSSHLPGPRRPKLSEKNETLNKSHDTNSRSKVTFQNENKISDRGRLVEDVKKQDNSKVWNNIQTAKQNSFLISVNDSNFQDERTLYSNKQLAYYSRITRENSTMPPPIDYNRRRLNAVPDGGYAVEKQYVKENYPHTKTELKRLANDQLSTGVYRTLMKRRYARLHYMRSLVQEDEKRFQKMQLACPRCSQKVAVDDLGNELSQIPRDFNRMDVYDGNNNDGSNERQAQISSMKRNEDVNQMPSHPKGLERFARIQLDQNNENFYNENIDKNELAKYSCIARDALVDSTSSDRTQAMVSAMNAPDYATRDVKSQFCDVLGKRTCRKCREFFAKHFRMNVEETVSKNKLVRPPSPPATPGDAFIPSQALHKVVIRVKDKQGVMAVAVGVNEDATVGL